MDLGNDKLVGTNSAGTSDKLSFRTVQKVGYGENERYYSKNLFKLKLEESE